MSNESLRLASGVGSELLDGIHQMRILRIREEGVTTVAVVYGRDMDDVIDLVRLFRSAPQLLAVCKRSLVSSERERELWDAELSKAIELAEGDA